MISLQTYFYLLLVYVGSKKFTTMDTLTIELTNKKALKLIQNLEDLKLIRVIKQEPIKLSELRKRIKTPMSPPAIETQLSELRKQWQRNI